MRSDVEVDFGGVNRLNSVHRVNSGPEHNGDCFRKLEQLIHHRRLDVSRDTQKGLATVPGVHRLYWDLCGWDKGVGLV